MKKIGLAAVALLAAGMGVKADNIDFTCSLGSTEHCSGSIALKGSDYQTAVAGIDVFNDFGPYNDTVPFLLRFNSATDVISIDGTGIYSAQDFLGQITNFIAINGGSSTAFEFNANWLTVPSEAQAWLGSSTASDSGFVITTSLVTTKKSGKAGSTDVMIMPVPEPGSLVLVGSGLLIVFGGIRRKLHHA